MRVMASSLIGYHRRYLLAVTQAQDSNLAHRMLVAGRYSGSLPSFGHDAFNPAR